MATTSFSNQIAEQPLLNNLVIDDKITPKSESIDALHKVKGEIKSAPDTILFSAVCITSNSNMVNLAAG